MLKSEIITDTLYILDYLRISYTISHPTKSIPVYTIYNNYVFLAGESPLNDYSLLTNIEFAMKHAENG